MNYDPLKAAAYWSGERLAKAPNTLAAVLSFSQPPFVNEAYDTWESTLVLETLGNIQSANVLDLACGVGRLTVRLASRGAIVTGIDIAQGMLDQAQAAAEGAGVSSLVTLVHAPAHELPLESGCMDAVVCAGLFEHLPGSMRKAAISEMHRVLRPGGKLVLVVNNSSSEYLQPAEDNPFRKGIQFDSGYFCELVNPEEVEVMMRDLGFEVGRAGANLHYSHVRHSINNGKTNAEAGRLQMAEALQKDLAVRLHPGEDERWADHIVLKALKPSAIQNEKLKVQGE